MWIRRSRKGDRRVRHAAITGFAPYRPRVSRRVALRLKVRSGLLDPRTLRPGLVAREVLPKVQDAGVLLTAAGESVLRFSPPLVVTIKELEEGVAALRSALA